MPLDCPLVPRIRAPRRPHPREADPDATRELRQLRDLRVARVDRVQVVARAVDEVARRHLGVPGPGVEQRRAAGQVGQRRHQPVEPDRLPRRPGEPAGHPKQEVLRRLDHQPGRRVPQQVPVVDRAQPEVLEPAIGLPVDREVELAGVVLDEPRGLVADQTLGLAQRDRLAERRDALVADLLVDVPRQQPGGQPGVLRLLADHLGGGLDRQPVQLGGGRAVVQAADGAGGDPHRVDVLEVAAHAVDRSHDLVDVDGLAVAVAFAHAHGGADGNFGDRHFSLLARSVLTVRDHAGRRRERSTHPALSRRPSHEASDHRTRRVRCAGRSSDSWAHARPLLTVASQVSPSGRPSADDGVRSHSPLRGSPGLTPGSLLPPTAWLTAGTSCTRHHM